MANQYTKAAQAAQTEPAAPEVPVEIYERRLLHGDLPPTLGIELTLPGEWYLRWINTQLDGRWQKAVREAGLIPVKASELADPRALTGVATSPDGMVTRGDRGQEVLCRMPLAWFTRIQAAKADRIRARQTSASAQKESLQEALAGQYGPQAAESMREWKGTISGGTERLEREDL